MKREIFSWMNPKLVVKDAQKYGKANFPVIKNGKKIYKKINGLGKGVYAKQDIKKGEVLFVMGGYILSIGDENELKGIVADKPIEVSENFSIGPRNSSDLPKMPQHYVNHSCNPNAGFDGQIFMVAMKPIKQEMEICFDYAMSMHSNTDSNSFFSFKCLCSSKNCRETISENDWSDPVLQKKYRGYFQYYLQSKIDRIKPKR